MAHGHLATAAEGDGTALIQRCAYYGDVSAIRFLLDRGESLQSLGENLGLGAAAFHGHWRLCEFLLEHGADAGFREPDSRALRRAAADLAKGHLEEPLSQPSARLVGNIRRSLPPELAIALRRGRVEATPCPLFTFALRLSCSWDLPCRLLLPWPNATAKNDRKGVGTAEAAPRVAPEGPRVAVNLERRGPVVSGRRGHDKRLKRSRPSRPTGSVRSASAPTAHRKAEATGRASNAGPTIGGATIGASTVETTGVTIGSGVGVIATTGAWWS